MLSQFNMDDWRSPLKYAYTCKIVENPSQTWSVNQLRSKLEPILRSSRSNKTQCETLETNASESTPLLHIKHLGGNKTHSSCAKICIFCDVVTYTVKEKKPPNPSSLSDSSLQGPRAISVLLHVNIWYIVMDVGIRSRDGIKTLCPSYHHNCWGKWLKICFPWFWCMTSFFYVLDETIVKGFR